MSFLASALFWLWLFMSRLRVLMLSILASFDGLTLIGFGGIAIFVWVLSGFAVFLPKVCASFDPLFLLLILTLTRLWLLALSMGFALNGLSSRSALFLTPLSDLVSVNQINRTTSGFVPPETLSPPIVVLHPQQIKPLIKLMSLGFVRT